MNRPVKRNVHAIELSRKAPLATRPTSSQRDHGHRRSDERHPGGRVRALHQNQELPLAHERSALPRLPPAAGRTGDSALRDDRPDRRTHPQDRRLNAEVHRPHRPHATRAGQRCRVRRTRWTCSPSCGKDNKELAARLREGARRLRRNRDVATASLIEVWIDETERRTWFLFEASRR